MKPLRHPNDPDPEIPMNRRPMLMLALMCWMSGSTPAPAASPAATPAPAAARPDLAAVTRAFDDRLAAALSRYSAKLDEIYARHRESGDLDAVLAVRAERARFLADGAPTEAGRVAAPADLAALQDQFLRQHARWIGEREAAISGFAQVRLRELFTLQKELTRQDKIEEALAVRKQIEALKAEHPGLAETPSSPEPAPAAVPPASPAPPEPPVDAHAMEWRFEEGSGKLSLPVEGTQAWRLEALSWVDGRNGKALGFNGAEGKAVLSPADWRARAGADSFTLAAWVRLDKSGRIAPIFSRQTEAARGWVLMTSLEGQLKLEVASPEGKLRLSTREILEPGTWHHVAMALQFGSAQTSGILYLDGAVVAQGQVQGVHDEPDLPVLLGRYRWSSSFDHVLAGAIDTVVLASPALDTEGVARLAR